MGWRAQQGQTAAEYLGVLLVVGVIIAAIGASGLAATVQTEISRSICQVSGAPDCDAAPQADRRLAERPASRVVERARENYALQSLAADAQEPTGGPAPSQDEPREGGAGESATDASGRGATSNASLYYARERFSPLNQPLFVSPQRREAILRKRASDGILRDGLGVAIPRPGDSDGDGLPDPRPVAQQREGGAGDRFAGELCGMGESLLFGVAKGPACSLGDKSTEGWQQGRDLANVAGIVAPDPSSKLRPLRSAVPSGAPARRPPPPSSGAHSSPPQPPPRAPDPPPHARPPEPPPQASPGTRTGTRQSREERNARAERPAQRPSENRGALLFKFDERRPVQPRAAEERLDLPLLRRPDGSFDTRALYRQNLGQLREAMRRRIPVRERDPAFRRSGAGRGGDFLEAERRVLKNRGWSRRGDTWYPPGD
jgi:hypothetical protein